MIARFACALALTLAAGGLAAAQGVAVDAEYRVYDRVYVRGVPDPLQGTILSGSESGASKLVIRLVSGIVHEVARNTVARIVPRETPALAFRTRAKAIAERGDAALHRRLAEWGYSLGLLPEAEAELELATRAEAEPTAAVGHRERLVALRLERAADLEGEARDGVLEGVLTVAAGEPTSPRLRLAHARVLLALGLPDAALPRLDDAAQRLSERAKGAAPEGGGTDPGSESGTDPGAGGADEGGEGGEPPRRFGGDGEGLPPAEEPAPGGARGPRPDAAVPEEDRSAELLPGLSPDERVLYRSVLTALGAAALAAREPARASTAFEQLLAVWPQDKEASLGLARILSASGDGPAAIALLDRALPVRPRDSELLLTRGELQYLRGDAAAARADLELALGDAARAAPEAAPGAEPAAETEGPTPLGRQLRAALARVALLEGRFDEAQRWATEADAEPGFGPARLVRGLVAELSGALPEANVHYDEAFKLLAPRAGEVSYARAFAAAKAGELDACAAALRASVAGGFAFELAARTLVNLSRGRGQALEEERLTELLARSQASPSPRLLAELGRVHLAARREADARRAFTRGLEADPNHPGCLRGLAYLAYGDDDRDGAQRLFERLLALDAKDAWASEGLRSLREASTRRVWTDSFDRAGPEIRGPWSSEARFGVTPGLDSKGALVFDGTQANEAMGKTLVSRRVSGERVVKVAAVFRSSDLNSARFGVRLESAQHRLVLLCEPGTPGRLAYATATGTGPWTDPVDLGPWPGSGAHTLAIDVRDPKQDRVVFLVDGELRGEVTLAGVGRGRGPYEVVLYTQGQAVGDRTRVTVEEARVYVLREGRSGQKGGF